MEDKGQILGIDIGIQNVGIGIIEASDGSLVGLDYISTSSKWKMQDRIRTIYERLKYIIEEHDITCITYEEVHFQNINTKEAKMKNEAIFRLNLIIGVVLLLAAQYNLHVTVQSPVRIKLLIGGSGACGKDAIQKRLLYVYREELSGHPEWRDMIGKNDHVADALAQARTTFILSREK